MEIKECQTCGARWVNDQLYWSNGKEGRELDLAGLVCNRIDPAKPCTNPLQGEEGGQTWEERQKRMDAFVMEL